VTTLDHRKKGKPVEFFELISACNLFDNNVKKKNAETQERKGLRSRNSKAFYLPCPYFLFFFAEFTWRICGSGNKRNALPQKPQGIVSHARLKRTGKDLAGKRHPRQATGGLRSRDPRIQRWRWRIARRQPFHLTERNS